MTEKILTVHVALDECLELEGEKHSVRMITFSGTADGPYFSGKILPGGVDTQKGIAGEKPILSARYMLEGTDDTGHSCRIFIENNGAEDADGVIRTVPVIATDSRSLLWMENACLEGTVEPAETGVEIHIFRK